MNGKLLWRTAKVLEGLGLIVILAGVFLSIRLGFQDRGLESMGLEFQGLAIGGGLFLLGWLLERALQKR